MLPDNKVNKKISSKQIPVKEDMTMDLLETKIRRFKVVSKPERYIYTDRLRKYLKSK